MPVSNLIVNGDFSAGNTGFLTDYSYVPAIFSETQYTVVAASKMDASTAYGPGNFIVSTDPFGGDGNVLLVNGAITTNQRVWSEQVTVIPNTDYQFSFYAVDVNNRHDGNDAVLQASINGVIGATLSTTGSWQQAGFVWNSGPNTTASISLVDTKAVLAGNDFAIDVISLSPLVPTPIVINNISDLQAIQNNLSGYYVLGANIDAAGFGFTPIGSAANPFTGIFDGQGYTISNLTINNISSTESGLFGAVGATSTVRNVGLINESVTSLNVDVGGLVGENFGTISKSYVSGTVAGAAFVGALVGLNGSSGIITESYATGAASGSNDVGGLVGLNQGVITESYATGSTNAGRPGLGIGGLVGINSGTITQSYATGPVGFSGGFALGGLVGSGSGAVTASYWDTETTGRSNSVGGTVLTTAELQSGILLTGFDPTIWLDITGQFPELLWQVTSSISPIERVSIASDGTQTVTAGSSFPTISGDGRYVAFESQASDLVDGAGGHFNVFVYDRDTKSVEVVSVAQNGGQPNNDSADPHISADGRYVGFSSISDQLVAGDTNGAFDAFVYDRVTHTTERVSVASDGSQLFSHGFLEAISADGQYVVFSQNISGLFVRDRVSQTTETVAATLGFGIGVSITLDGTYIAFGSSDSALVAGDTNNVSDIFVYNRVSHTTERVSIGYDGSQANNDSREETAISADGRYVAFASRASNLVTDDTNNAQDIFVYDRINHTTERVSVASDGTQANGGSVGVSISADGRYVTFTSSAANLVTGATLADAFVYDRVTHTIQRVAGAGQDAMISADGKFIAFDSSASNLVPGDTNGLGDIFVVNRALLPVDNPPASNHAPVVSNIHASPITGNLGPGAIVTLTVTFNEAVTVAGGIPSITLNDGGIATYQSGSGSSALIFIYTVGALGGVKTRPTWRSPRAMR